MTGLAPLNVMGPAHRGNVIQQLAQTAAQNVMRRQKLKALIGQTASKAGGGVSQPFRGSTTQHAIGGHGQVQRPGQGQFMVSPGLQMLSGAGPNPGGPMAAYPDPGGADLGSLPTEDPTASPAQSAPPTEVDPSTLLGQSSPFTAPIPGGGTATQTAPGSDYYRPNPPSGQTAGTIPAPGGAGGGGYVQPGGVAGVQVGSLIPLGAGVFYNPATDEVTGADGVGTGNRITPGLQR